RNSSYHPTSLPYFCSRGHLLYFIISSPPPTATLFPYTTLFRSQDLQVVVADQPDVDLAPLDQLFDDRGLVVFAVDELDALLETRDRKSTRLNSSHLGISYAVFCLKKKKQ